MGGFTNPWANQTITAPWLSNTHQGIQFSYLTNYIDELSAVVKSKIAQMQSKTSAMSIADMFDLQSAMNKLAQVSEMATSIVSSFNTTIMDYARNIKG